MGPSAKWRSQFTPAPGGVIARAVIRHPALSPTAILALNEGARRGGFYHDTGEGSISLYHRVNGGDIEAMAKTEPYVSACKKYSYDWDASPGKPRTFDYDGIDFFRGHPTFDNGEPIGTALKRIHLHEVVDARTRWPEPWLTDGDSFWNWLAAPSAAAELDPRFPPGTLTNVMSVVYKLRSDLLLQYKDPVGDDRLRFLNWFVLRANFEVEIPWGLISPVLESHCAHLNKSIALEACKPAGRITRVRMHDAQGKKTHSFRCGDGIQIELEFCLDEAVPKPVIGYSLRTADGGLIFGTNTTLLDAPLPELAAGKHRYRISSTLSIQPQHCLVSAGVACYDPGGVVVPIHRMINFQRITVRGKQSDGVVWCPTTIADDSTR